MNLIELNRALHQLRLDGMVATMETRLQQAQTENMAPIDLISTLVSDELACRSKRLLDPGKSRRSSATTTSAWIISTSNLIPG